MFKETKELSGSTGPFVITGIIWFGISAAALSAIGLGISYFATPAQVAIENRTFHQSQPYQDGMARDLENWRLAYADASPEGKAAIRSTIRHRFAGFNPATLPSDDQLFLSEMK